MYLRIVIYVLGASLAEIGVGELPALHNCSAAQRKRIWKARCTLHTNLERVYGESRYPLQFKNYFHFSLPVTVHFPAECLANCN